MTVHPTDAEIQQMLAQAERHQAAPPMVEHHLNGCGVQVADEQLPNGQTQKVVMFIHPSGHVYIAKLPRASAKQVAQALLKPPPVPVIQNGHKE
jgi:hypothetical protein